jgi:hypothetical protein
MGFPSLFDTQSRFRSSVTKQIAARDTQKALDLWVTAHGSRFFVAVMPSSSLPARSRRLSGELTLFRPSFGTFGT